MQRKCSTWEKLKFQKFVLLIRHPSFEDETHGGVMEKGGMNTAFPLTTPGTHMAKTKPTVWQALLEVPGRMSQEPRLLSGVGLCILRQGLAQAPLCSALPAWGRPGLNLQGNLHLGPGRAGIHGAALRTSRSAREGVRVRGTKLGWRQGRGYLLSGSSRAWNLQRTKEQ